MIIVNSNVNFCDVSCEWLNYLVTRAFGILSGLDLLRKSNFGWEFQDQTYFKIKPVLGWRIQDLDFTFTTSESGLLAGSVGRSIFFISLGLVGKWNFSLLIFTDHVWPKRSNFNENLKELLSARWYLALRLTYFEWKCFSDGKWPKVTRWKVTKSDLWLVHLYLAWEWEWNESFNCLSWGI